MNKNVAIVTDTNSGMTIEDAKKYNVYMLPMPFIVNGVNHFENISMTYPQFFEELAQGADVSTSQPSPGDILELWEKLLKEYDEIVHIPMSSGLSSSCHTATALAEDFDNRIFVVNNQRVSVTMRQSVVEAVALAKAGKTGAEIKEYLEKDGLNSSIYVAVDTLEYLKKSGRVTAAGAAIGTVLSIKPVLQIQGGKLDAFKKVRGMKQAMKAMIDGIGSDIKNRFPGKEIVVRVAYSGDIEIGNAWREAVMDAFPALEIGMDALPLSISCHVGAGAMGIGVMEKMKELQ